MALLLLELLGSRRTEAPREKLFFTYFLLQASHLFVQQFCIVWKNFLHAYPNQMLEA